MPNSLQDLPLELLALICSYLCAHCFPYKIDIWKPSCDAGGIPYEDRYNCRLGLYSLAAASRKLRCVARPTLWHRLQPRPSAFECPEFLVDYIRFLKENSDLRSDVKSLVINTEGLTLDPGWPGLSAEERHVVRRASKQVEFPSMMESLNYSNCVETLVQILITITPNLTELHFAIPYTWSFDHLQVLRYKGVAIGEKPKELLSNLKHLEIQVIGPEHAKCSPGHLACKVAQPVCVAEQILIESAPRLETLSCTAGGLDNLPLLSRLKHLELQPKGYWEKVMQLFDRLPSLTHLRYCTANEHSPSPRLLQLALKPLADTLELLSISVQRFITRPTFGDYDDWEPPSGDDWVMESLAAFTSLKSLTIDSGMIWRGSGQKGARWFDPRDGGKMGRFLPPSIETVFIDDLYGDVGPLLPLAQSVAGGVYPNLKRVIWYEVECIGDVIMKVDDRHGIDWLEGGNWKTSLCNNLEWSHIQSTHTLSEGHLVAFPDWEDLYQEHCRRHMMERDNLL